MFTYLFFNFFVVIIPLLLSFEKRIRYFKKWKYVFLASLIVALPFLLWDEIFAQNKIWGFSGEYLTGIKLFSLPAEEILFFFAIPFSCIYIFEFIKLVVKFSKPRSQSLYKIFTSLSIISLFLAIGLYSRVYTFVNFLILSFTFAFISKEKPKFVIQFLLAFLITLIPFVIGNGILTSGISQVSENPIVWYNNSENLLIRINSIPLDDFFYWFSLFFWNVFVYEKLRERSRSGN